MHTILYVNFMLIYGTLYCIVSFFNLIFVLEINSLRKELYNFKKTSSIIKKEKNMKTILILLISCLSIHGYAQEIPENAKNAFENDNATLLLEEIQKNTIEINGCYTIKEKNYSLFAIAIKLDTPNIFNALITNKANVNIICEDKSPLMYAAKYGKLNYCQKLVAAGCDVSLINNDKKSALDYAEQYQQIEIITYLKTFTNK
jgi:uncharacterized protein